MSCLSMMLVGALAFCSIVHPIPLVAANKQKPKAASITETAGTNCAPVLQSGVYNTVRTSVKGTSYNDFQTAACSYSSSYTYEQYSADWASTTSKGKALNVNFGFDGFKLGFGGSTRKLTRTEFGQYQQYAAAYVATACGSSTVQSGNDANVQTLSQFIQPEVYQAYIACLNVYSSGVRISQMSGVDSSSLTLDIKFVPNQPGATAIVNGLYIRGPGTCTVLQATQPVKFSWKLVPNTVYTVACSIPATAAKDNGITDIFISTSIGGSFHALLFRGSPQTDLDILKGQVTLLQNQVSALQTNVLQTTENYCIIRKGGECPPGWQLGLIGANLVTGGCGGTLGEPGDMGFMDIWNNGTSSWINFERLVYPNHCTKWAEKNWGMWVCCTGSKPSSYHP